MLWFKLLKKNANWKKKNGPWQKKNKYEPTSWILNVWYEYSNMCQSKEKRTALLIMFLSGASSVLHQAVILNSLWCLFLYIYKALDKINVTRCLIRTLSSSSSYQFFECGVFYPLLVYYDFYFLLFQLQCLVKKFNALC